MQPDNATLMLQRTVADLQQRLMQLEAVIKVTGKDVAIGAFGNLTITSHDNLTISCGTNRSDSVAGNYALTVNGYGTEQFKLNYSFSTNGTVQVWALSNYRVNTQREIDFQVGTGLRSNMPLSVNYS
jgi:hypothetical protein